MTWLCLADHDVGLFDPKGISGKTGPAQAVPNNSLVPRGSLMVETRLSPDGRPQTLLDFRRAHPWKGRISLQAIPGGGIALILAQGEDLFHTVLQHGIEARTDVLRITYSWDAPARAGRFAIEHPETGSVIKVATPPPPPLMLEDLRVLTQRPQLREMDEDMLYLAVSNKIEPLGPMPTLTDLTPILTGAGYKRVMDFRRGDTLRADTGDIVPVLETVRRVVPARGSFRPVRLRAPYFGLQQDVVVAPEQRLVIGGSEVEYMFGQEAVLVPARHLVNGVAAIHEEGHRLVRYHQIVLPHHEAMHIAGTDMESLYLGRMRRKPDELDHSLFAGIDRNRLPEHAKSVYPVLKPFEAITLAQNRAA